jgi:hypothetical protein
LQTLDEVCACAQHHLTVPTVVDGFRARPDDLERDSTPVEAPCSLLRWNFDLEGFVGVSIHCSCPFVPTIDFTDVSPELASQRFCQGCFHDVLEFAQTVTVYGVLVVLSQSTIALLVYFDDFCIREAQQSWFMDRFAISLVPSGCFVYLSERDAQPDGAVNAPSLAGSVGTMR